MGVDFKVKKLGLGNEQLTYLPTAGARLANGRWQAWALGHCQRRWRSNHTLVLQTGGRNPNGEPYYHPQYEMQSSQSIGTCARG